MKQKGIVYLVAFIVIITLAIGGTMLQNKLGSSSTETENATAKVEVVQLAEKGRPDASTMTLLYAPPLQPVTHIDRWNPEQHEKSCFACHGKPETGAPTPPADHFYDNDTKGKVFRDNCVQCHAQQNQTKSKTAFGK
jgi:nitrate reductase (cytochrome), electron transfer subunit